MRNDTNLMKQNSDHYLTHISGMTESQFEELLWTMVEEALSYSAHDMDHIKRVYRLAIQIASHYPDVNYEVLVPSVLLHDIGRRIEDQDPSGQTDHAVVGSVMARDILKRMEMREDVVCAVQEAILTHRFRSGSRPATLEAAILYDADKLDAIGAAGIARTFMMAGQEGSRMYKHVDLEAYGEENLTEHGRILNLEDHAPNVEYLVKLKHIPERLMTPVARQMALGRAELMRIFFEALDHELTE